MSLLLAVFGLLSCAISAQCILFFHFPRKSMIDSTYYENAFTEAQTQLKNLESINTKFLEAGIDKPEKVFSYRMQVGKKTRNIRKAGIISKLMTKDIVRRILKEKFGQIDSSFFADILNIFLPKEMCPYIVSSCNVDFPYRTMNGSCNNLKYPNYGMANTPFKRIIPPNYDDGTDHPRTRGAFGFTLPSTRHVTNTVLLPNSHQTSHRYLSTFSVYYLQFESHDMERFAVDSIDGRVVETDCCHPDSKNRESCFPIDIPKDDPFFRRYNRRCMNFQRSMPVPRLNCMLGTREQLNQVTSFLDASNIYGTTAEEVESLRSHENGELKLMACGKDALLPPDLQKHTECDEDLNPGKYPCFLAGDVRVNENIALSVMHTIWMREHNRVARAFSKLNPHWSDETIFQEARRVVISEKQHITFNELLPLILGDRTMKMFRLYSARSGYNHDYDPNIDPSMAHGFSTAAFRFPHSLVDNFVLAIGGCPYSRGQCRPRKAVRDFLRGVRVDHSRPHDRRVCKQYKMVDLLRNVFTRPDVLYDTKTNVDKLVQGLIFRKAQKVDHHVTKELTDHLFESEEGNGNDLVAMNMQRARDHGVPAYNKWRTVCNLPPAKHWGTGKDGFTDHTPELVQRLHKAYNHPDDIDLFIGGLTEIHRHGSILGPTFTCIIANQFFSVKHGDRFWYENSGRFSFSPDKLQEVRKARMARIILDNTDTQYVSQNPFQTSQNFHNTEVNRFENPGINLELWKEEPTSIY